MVTFVLQSNGHCSTTERGLGIFIKSRERFVVAHELSITLERGEGTWSCLLETGNKEIPRETKGCLIGKDFVRAEEYSRPRRMEEMESIPIKYCGLDSETVAGSKSIIEYRRNSGFLTVTNRTVPTVLG